MTPPAESTESAQSLQDAFNQVIQLCVAGDFTRAEAACEAILQASPDQPDAVNLMGLIATQRGNHNRAIECFQKLIIIKPKDDALHFNLAKNFQKTERFEDAKESFEKALALSPHDMSSLINYGHVCKNLGDWNCAFPAFRHAAELKRQPGSNPKSHNRTFSETSRAKLNHDIEQLNYLKTQGHLPPHGDDAIAAFTELKKAIPEEANDGQVIEIPPVYRDQVGAFYNRLMSLHDSELAPGGALNSALDSASIEEDYHRNAPGITYLDDFLTPESLESLRRFCLNSTIWYEYGYANGYLGAFMEEGFLTPLLYQIAEELPQALPSIFEDYKLSYLWAYKYDSKMTGINLHGDDAAINVNFWITPDEANLDPNTGGLVIWDQEAPADWDFFKMNANYDAMRGFLSEKNAKKTPVPHKQNRAVIFNSDLFHETDTINFKEGYENRRINVTMLFGRSRIR
jgi:tetratricopeptide (TPR) repeat protein